MKYRVSRGGGRGRGPVGSPASSALTSGAAGRGSATSEPRDGWQSPRRPYRRRRAAISSSSSSCAAVLFLVALLVPPVSAVLIPWENCLPDNYRGNKDPVLLQWVPAFVDASFDTVNANHTLRVTMYGNVTGASSRSPLPPWNSPDWRDPNVTAGKILQEPNPASSDPKLTTLHSKVDVLTYEPWNKDTDFCAQSLTNASCPLGPVFNTTAM